MFWIIVFALLWGCLCSSIARNKNLNPRSWFWGGFFFGIFALIVLCFCEGGKNESN
jgi:hypothetical protein